MKHLSLTCSITSNDHPFDCPIIYIDTYSQCYYVHWYLQQCLIQSRLIGMPYLPVLLVMNYTCYVFHFAHIKHNSSSNSMNSIRVQNGKTQLSWRCCHAQCYLQGNVLKNETLLLFFVFLINFWRTWVLFVGPLIPLFQTSGDVSSGFQSQSGFCLIWA